jgi:hypothetical protein
MADLTKYIIEAEKISKEKGDIYFVFDTKSKNDFKQLSKEEKRDVIIDEILEEDIYYVDSIKGFDSNPSRMCFYDTVTKETCRYKRYNKIIVFINSLGFEHSMTNLGCEYEQSFFLEYALIRVSPNCWVRVFDRSDHVLKFNGFFNPIEIRKTIDPLLTRVTNRDIKINNILE